MPYYGYGEGGSSGSEESDSEGALSSSSSDQGLPFPGFTPVALRYLTQDSRPRSCETTRAQGLIYIGPAPVSGRLPGVIDHVTLAWR
ncbi:unnamed protein product [Plutella xylostella]|uniref:(diamondback moth) hypothetical protein n=1 Tax=Plutella xylostella TaxID=51655 RepID=A0A8S4FX41_PLUXY|nr:unnamed protein product [Plutella xylostella]